MNENTTKDLTLKFRVVGILFERIFREGFSNRKPKKIMIHTRQALRAYRSETSKPIFGRLTGTILTWRYAGISKIPNREWLKLERSILRSFNYLLREVSLENNEELVYLASFETGPQRSIMSPGNPLGHLLKLKLLEFEIQDSKTSPKVRDTLEQDWKELHTDLHRQFRFRIPNPIS